MSDLALLHEKNRRCIRRSYQRHNIICVRRIDLLAVESAAISAVTDATIPVSQDGESW